MPPTMCRGAGQPGLARPGDVWQIGAHRLICGDATDPAVVRTLMAGELVRPVFHPRRPYGNQRDYTNTIIELGCPGENLRHPWPLERPGAGQSRLLIHRANREVIPYWDGWFDWMRTQGWRRFAWYVWDQARIAWRLKRPAGPWPSSSSSTSTGRTPRPAARTNCPCIYAGRDTHLAGDGTSAGGMRNKDGSKTAWNHVGQVTQETKIPDSVIRIMRHRARSVRTSTTRPVFLVALPQFVWSPTPMRGEIVFEPFCGRGTTPAGRRTHRQKGTRHRDRAGVCGRHREALPAELSRGAGHTGITGQTFEGGGQ